MHQRTSLSSGKYCFVYFLCKFLLTQNHPASWTSQGFMSGRGYEIRIVHGIRVKTCCNNSCYMRHINHKISAYIISNFSECFKINNSGIGACPCNYHFWLFFFCDFSYLIIINCFSFLIYSIEYNIKV